MYHFEKYITSDYRSLRKFANWYDFRNDRFRSGSFSQLTHFRWKSFPSGPFSIWPKWSLSNWSLFWSHSFSKWPDFRGDRFRSELLSEVSNFSKWTFWFFVWIKQYLQMSRVTTKSLFCVISPESKNKNLLC